MKGKFYLITILLISLVFQSCDNGFYKYSKGRDYSRVPLISPYEVTSVNQNNWFFDLKSKKFEGDQLERIDKIGVKDSFFVLYSSKVLIPEYIEVNSPAWFIVDAKSKEEMFFLSEESYKKALDSLGIGQVKLYNTKKVFTNFDNTGELPPEWPKESKQ